MNSQSPLILAPYIRVGFSKDKLFLGFGSIQQAIEDPSQQDILLEAALAWKEPKTISEIVGHLQSIFAGKPKEIEEAVSRLVAGRFLIPAGSYDRSDRFSRQSLFYALSGADPARVQNRLKQKHVAILGSGGIGNMVAVTLATMGLRKLSLVDGDVIEPSNLSRQLMFTEADVRKKKVATLKAAIRNRVSGVEIDTICEPVSAAVVAKIARPVDLLVLSADTVGLTGEINAFCVRNRIPFISIGYIQDIAVFGPFVIPGKTGCFDCRPLKTDNLGISEDRLSKVKKINRGYQAPSIGPLNMMAAAHGVLDILKYLGDFGEIHSLNKRIGIWTHEFRVEEQSSVRNPNCATCGNLFERQPS